MMEGSDRRLGILQDVEHRIYIPIALWIAVVSLVVLGGFGSGQAQEAGGEPPMHLARCIQTRSYAVDLRVEVSQEPVTAHAAPAYNIYQDVAPSSSDDIAEAQGDPIDHEPVILHESLIVNGVSIPYIQCRLSSTAPDDVAGLWWGDDDTCDGELGYFCGHNPGVFADVANLVHGDSISVCDGAGAAREYTVVDVFDVPNTASLNDLFPRILGHGESIALQTCVDDALRYRIVLAIA